MNFFRDRFVALFRNTKKWSLLFFLYRAPFFYKAIIVVSYLMFNASNAFLQVRRLSIEMKWKKMSCSNPEEKTSNPN